MTRSLSPHPDLAQLKRQAKELRKAQQAQDPSACPVLRHLRRFADAPEAYILAAPLSLHEAQYALAMEYGFTSWQSLQQHVRSTTVLSDARIRVALVSYQVRSGDPEANLRVVETVLRAQADAGIRLFVLPEVSISGWPPKVDGQRDYARFAEPVPDGPLTARVAALARQYRTTVCAGLMEACEDCYFITHILCGPDGYLGKQQKLFPSRGLMNDGMVSGGQHLGVHQLFGQRCVILASTDWLFPEGAYLAGTHEAALIIAPTDGFDLQNESTLRSIACTRAMDTHAHLIAAIGGDAPHDAEVMAGLAASPSGKPEEMVHCETRRLDEVKVMTLDLLLQPPQSRWGSARARAPRVLTNLVEQQIEVG
ncbi:MAG: carbon-nitrogen hydrolase family protein [Armatimonadota bacterium]